jgi:uncharacterized protein (DUF885 family)
MTSENPTPIFQLSDAYITESAKLSPIAATFLGIPGFDDQLDDFSLDGSKKKQALIRDTLRRLGEMQPQNGDDGLASAVMQERLSSELALLETYSSQVICAVISSPAINIRQVFEVMPYETAQDIGNITHRLEAVLGALESWKSSLIDLGKMGKRPATRQVTGVADQLKKFSAGAFSGIAERIDPEKKYSDLHAAAVSADRAAGAMSDWMRTSYLPETKEADGVGLETYSAWARHFTGADLDLRETYEWGLQDLAAINARMWEVALKIKPDATSLREVADYLDNDPKYLVKGSDVLLEMLQEFTQAATNQLDAVYFDIDPRIKFCDARIAPEGSAAAPYYQPPSEDLSRPGTTWFPTQGKNVFNWWRIPTMWYHEAVPGHHLQVATVIIEKEHLSRFQRTDAWTSGHGEGWALYAERLMDELGGFGDPGYEMGHLSAQAWRAVRVVVDIGLHLGYEDENGKVWSYESAVALLMSHALLEEDFAKSEIDRYLGIAGQAISYKVGERVWLSAREEAKKRLGDKFSLKKFHAFALRLGPMGLDPFAAELSKWDGH